MMFGLKMPPIRSVVRPVSAKVTGSRSPTWSLSRVAVVVSTRRSPAARAAGPSPWSMRSVTVEPTSLGAMPPMKVTDLAILAWPA